MVNTEKQIAYWRDGADEAWEVGADLVERDKILYGLFFVHLAMEKMLKAHVCKLTQELAPKIHALRLLAEKANLALSDKELAQLDELNIFCIVCRYPDPSAPKPSKNEARRIVKETEILLQWLKSQL